MNKPTMKVVADDENEIHDPLTYQDPDPNVVTAVIQLAPVAAQAVVESVASIVRNGHAQERDHPTPPGEIKRAQEFEEGEVYMLEPPFERYFADRYVMDFYDVIDRDICSRMHMHTGLRFVRMMTGVDTIIRVSSLSPFYATHSPGWTGEELEQFEDRVPDCEDRVRHNLVVPTCSWVDMQIPRGVSHQFNASGPNAVIDSVHVEESIEVVREQMSGFNMMAQTIFFAEEKPSSDTCLIDSRVGT